MEDDNEGLLPLKLKYYNYVLGKNTDVPKEEAIVFKIMEDFTDRRGLRQLLGAATFTIFFKLIICLATK